MVSREEAIRSADTAEKLRQAYVGALRATEGRDEPQTVGSLRRMFLEQRRELGEAARQSEPTEAVTPRHPTAAPYQRRSWFTRPTFWIAAAIFGLVWQLIRAFVLKG